MDSFGLSEVQAWLSRTPAALGRGESGPMGEARLVTPNHTIHTLVFVGVLNCPAYLARLERPLSVLGRRPRWRWLRAPGLRQWVDGPIPVESIPPDTRAALSSEGRMPILGLESGPPEGTLAVWGEAGEHMLIVVPQSGTPLVIGTHETAQRALPNAGELHWFSQIAGGAPHVWSIEL